MKQIMRLKKCVDVLKKIHGDGEASNSTQRILDMLETEISWRKERRSMRTVGSKTAKPKIIWEQIWNELKRSEGGCGLGIVSHLKEKGIKARSCHSPYVGHLGVEVASTQAKRAEKIINKFHGYSS